MHIGEMTDSGALNSSHCFRQETSPMLSVCLRSYCITVILFIQLVPILNVVHKQCLENPLYLCELKDVL